MAWLRTDPLFILTVLGLLVVLSEWLARRPFFRHLGSALIVIILTAIVANAGLIPAGSTAEAPVPVYDAVFGSIAPIAIFWLLLPVNLRDVLRAGLPLIALFLVGAAATMAGVVIATHVVGAPAAFGTTYHGVAGMFAATYIGGGINFNAVALQYGVVRDAGVFAGSIVVDNVITTIWIVTTLALPRALANLWPNARRTDRAAAAPTGPIVDLAAEIETVDPRKLALALALGIGALWASNALAAAFAAIGWTVPSILIITTLAVVLAQVRPISRLPGTRVLGMVAVYLFLAVVGAFCDVRALGRLGSLGLVIFAFAAITVAVHGAITFGAAWIFRMDLDGAAVASQANVGGSTSALALAKSLGREDLLVPGILLGSLGNAVGTFLGFLVASLV